VKKFKIKSYCKINLTLKVLKKLNNGYHKINSLITFCDLHDEIVIRKLNGFNDKINFTGKFKKSIKKRSNTITKILNILRSKKILKNHYFEINIKKNIPHGSGLGGGSVNAAVLLNFLNFKMRLKLNKKSMYQIAKKVGFDTPIGLNRKNTFLFGKNNKIIRLNNKFNLNILIVYPNIVSSTKKIYLKNKKFSKYKNLPSFNTIRKKKLVNFLKKENNDLEEAVVKKYPKIKEVINYINSQRGCYFSRITGSGSAIIGIFRDANSAIYAKKLIKLKFPKYWSIVSKTI
tara:strand:- start:57 stop:920 length:864 start_codon:yes stop_codon:yes gene_type:complete